MPESVRNEIRTRHDVNFVVIAGAGTGKTTLLVDKLLALIRDGQARLSEMAAITFTEKAAAEISLRVKNEIEAALVRGEDPDGRLARARDELDGAAITTLHGFAARLLRDRAVEAGLVPDHEILDDVRTRLMFEEVYARWEAEALSQPREAWRRLLNERVDRALPELAESMVQYLDLVEVHEVAAPVPVSELAGRLADRLQAVCATLATCLPGARDPDDKAAARGRTLLAALPRFDREYLLNPTRALRDLDALPLNRRKVGKKGAWLDPALLEQVNEAVADAVEAVAEYRSGWQHILAHDAWQVLQDFLSAYRTEKSVQGVVEFQDLLIRTRDLLRDRKDVRGFFQNRYRVILVDEFQDTDPLQAEIVFYLAEDGPTADDWRNVRLAPGKLFIVGDPKQSIYRFRRADVEVFEEVRARVVAQGGEERTLERNFRSVSGVIDFVNAYFAGHIRRPQDGGRYQPDYAPLVPVRHSAPGTPRVELLVHTRSGYGEKKGTGEGGSKPRGFSADQARELEARMMAARIERMIHRERLVPDGSSLRPVRPGDIAILFRATSHLDVYTDALQDRGVPVRIIGSTRFYAAQEVIDASNLLRAIVAPHDTLALVAVLRSPAFGFDDVAITRLVRSGLLDYRRWQALDALEEGTQTDLERIRKAFHTLDTLHHMRDRVSMPALVSEALNRTLLLPTAYAAYAGQQKILNLEKVRSLARTYEAAGMRSVEAFSDTLLRAIVGKRQEEEMSDAEAGDDVVRILTIHKAKGLEWPVVFVPGLMSSYTGAASFLVRRDSGRFGFRAGSAQTRDWEELKEYERPREEAERVRLLYVAMTRARDYLVLTGVQQARQGKAAGLTALSAFMDARVGPGWREPGVHPVVPAGEGQAQQGGGHLVVRTGPVKTYLEAPPMSAGRADLVGLVDLCDREEVIRTVPEVLASRARARARRKPHSNGQEPLCWKVDEPDSLARFALSLAPLQVPPSPAERLDLAAQTVPGQPRTFGREEREQAVDLVARILESPLSRRLADNSLVDIRVPVRILVADACIVETTVDLLFRDTRGAPVALGFVSGRQDEDTPRIDALTASLADSSTGEHTGRLIVCRLDTGDWQEVPLDSARARQARARLEHRWRTLGPATPGPPSRPGESALDT